MSKSKGNTVTPQDIMNQSGADILRLWVTTTDYWEDQRLGKSTICRPISTPIASSATRCDGCSARSPTTRARRSPHAEMPELERLMLHRLVELDRLVRKGYDDFDFKRIARSADRLHANVELSAFYFDIRKDALYCDAPSSMRRKAALQAVATMFDCLVTGSRRCCPSPWKRPGSTAIPKAVRCISSSFPKCPGEWLDEALRPSGARMRHGPPCRHRRAGDRAPGKAHRLLARGRPDCLHCRPPNCARRSERRHAEEICITSGIASAPKARRPPTHSGSTRWPASPSFRRWRRAANAPVPGASPTMSARDPEYPDVSARDAAALRELDALGRLDRRESLPPEPNSGKR